MRDIQTSDGQSHRTVQDAVLHTVRKLDAAQYQTLGEVEACADLRAIVASIAARAPSDDMEPIVWPRAGFLPGVEHVG